MESSLTFLHLGTAEMYDSSINCNASLSWNIWPSTKK